MKQTQTTKEKQLKKQTGNADKIGGGHKAQKLERTKRGEKTMKNQKNTVVSNNKQMPDEEWRDAVCRQFEAEKIDLFERILKAKKLSYETDINLIPIVQIDVKDLSLSKHPWGRPCTPEDKINPNTPVVLGREYDVIAGAYQYFNAKEKGLNKINAVYIDSLPWKRISLSNLRKQFKDESICISFAYNLYALIYKPEDKISYAEFYNDADKFFDEEEIWYRIHQYVSSLNEEIGA